MSRRKQLNPKSFLKNNLEEIVENLPVEGSSALKDTDRSCDQESNMDSTSQIGPEAEEMNLVDEEARSCSRESGNSSPLQIDEEDMVDGESRSIYRCSFCQERFLEPGIVKQHEQLHADMMPYKCRHCSKGFKHKRSQDRHEQLHTGYKKHKCSSCDAAFFRSDHLKLHLKTHESPCGRSGQNGLLTHVNDLKSPCDFGRNGTPTNCTLCSKKFSSADQLLNHMDSEHAIMDSSSAGHLDISSRSTPASTPLNFSLGTGLICPHCTKQDFISEEALDLHIAAVHGKNGNAVEEQRLICGLCQQLFGTVEQLQKHTLHRHSVQDLPGNARRRNTGTSYFSGQYGDPRYGCQFCEKSFDGILSLHQHTSAVHPNAEEEELERQNNSSGSSAAYVCGQCSCALPDLTSFTAHMRQHLVNSNGSEGLVRPIRPTCDICGIECKDNANLDAHLVDHYLHKESQYSCSSCTKIFSQPDDLQKHLIDVHALHVFKCSLCKELFESRVDIQVHFAVVHSKEMVQWRCRCCNSAFSSEDQFRVHVEVVHIQRPLAASAKIKSRDSFVCNICNVQCATESDLKEHTVKHSPFTCPLCCQAFSVEYLFERHMESAHAGFLYSSPLKTSSGTHSIQNSTIVGYSNPLKKSGNYSSNEDSGLFFPTILGNSTSLKCNICDQKATSIEDLAEHKLNHCKVTKAENCYVCFKTLESTEEFCEHTKQHNTVQGLPVSCIVCRQTLLSLVELQCHAKFHLCADKSLDDTSSTRSASEAKTIKKEADSETEGESTFEEVPVKIEIGEEKKSDIKSPSKPFQCIKCQKSFSTEAEIQTHVTSHVLQDGVEHLCLLCQKVLDSPAKLQAHLIEHSFAGCSEFQCYLCGLVFSLPQPLSQHMLSHGADERPYDCPYCDQRFFFRAELDNHVLSHQKHSVPLPPLKRATENPDSMKIRRDFPTSKRNTMSPLTNGRTGADSSSANSAPSSFPCPHCPKVFGSLSALQGHSHVHMTNRIHQCNRCDKSFPTATKLRNHQRQHSGDKPYSCDICSRQFSRKDNLKVHLRTHYKEGYAGSGDELPTMVVLSNSSVNENDWSNSSES